jgi:hypothetical protein
MAREINRLSARRVTTEKRPGRHPDGAGFYLSISPNGGRRWVFIFKRGGKSREMGLGSASTVKLAVARSLADDARATLAKGMDPIAERDAKNRAAATASDGSWHALQGVLNGGASSDINVDGTQNIGAAGANAFVGSVKYGSAGAAQFMNGTVVEIGVWNSAFNSTQSSNMSSNQHSYWGF